MHGNFYNFTIYRTTCSRRRPCFPSSNRNTNDTRILSRTHLHTKVIKDTSSSICYGKVGHALYTHKTHAMSNQVGQQKKHHNSATMVIATSTATVSTASPTTLPTRFLRSDPRLGPRRTNKPTHTRWRALCTTYGAIWGDAVVTNAA